MESLIQTLTLHPVLTLFLVIGLGYLLGELKVCGFNLGLAGVLFVGLAFGSLSPKLALPEIVSSLGLVVFVYTIGIQAGPGFQKMFKQRGLRDSLLGIGVLGVAALLTLALGLAFRLPGVQVAGLFCGSVTNTPALAAVRETLLAFAQRSSLGQQETDALLNQPVVAYSIAYPVGVLGVILCFQFLRWWWQIKESPPEAAVELGVGNFVVTNPAVYGKNIGAVMKPHHERNFILSRVRHDGQTHLVSGDTRLMEGDLLVAVGDEAGLQLAEQILGSRSGAALHLDRSEFDYRRIFVSSKEVVGKQIQQLNLVRRFEAIITRVRRGDVDMVATPQMRLQYGDRVRVLTHRKNIEAISRLFGDSIRGTAEADFGAMAAGMVLGVLVGMIPVALPGGTSVRLGLAGGPLLVALVLGNIQHTGKISWVMPLSANLTLRQIGLLLFLGAIGTRAGSEFVRTFEQSGLWMLFAGAIVTFSTTLLAMFIGHKKLKLPFDYLMGLMAGVQTQPAALAFANAHASSDAPDVAYASVYPAATIAKIVLAQIILSVSGGLAML